MTGPMPITPDDAEFQKWKSSHAAPVTHDDAEFQAWKAQQGGPSTLQKIARMLPQSSPQLEDFKAFTPSNLATEAQNLGQSIPGGKALQAVSQMLPKALGGQGLSYSDAYKRVGQQVADLPTSHKVLADLASGAAMAGMGTAANIGAKAIGVASPFINRILNPQPTTPLNAAMTTGESLVGGLLPSVLNMGAARGKSGLAPTGDAVVNDARGDRIAADQINYSKVADEAQKFGGTNAAIRSALADPKIAPYVAAVRRYNPSDISDVDLLTKTRALMSERQGKLIPADAVDPGFGSTEEKAFLGRQKAGLTAAASSPDAQPPLTFNVPAETKTVEPIISPEREPQTGPMQERNLSEYTSREQPTTAQLQRNFMAGDQPGPGARQGPGGFSFRMARDPGHIVPGVNVDMPAMHIQTAPPGPPLIPSFPGAIAKTAENMQARDAGDLAAKVARRQFRGTPDPTNSDKFEKLGLAGYAQEAAANTPAEQQMAQARVLAELKNYPLLARLGRMPLPAPSLATRRAPDMLRAVGAPPMSDFLSKLLTASATSPFGR